MGVLRARVNGEWVEVAGDTGHSTWDAPGAKARPTEGASLDSAWGAAVHDKVSPLVYKGFTRTTDASGQISITAAELGLALINGVVGNILFSVSAGQPHRLACRLFTTSAVPSGGTSVQCIVYNMANTIVASTSTTIWLIAWGTPL